MKYTLPSLPYAYDALEPYIDEQTMEIHHTKHHQAYVDKLNEVLEKYADLAERPLEDLLKNLDFSLQMDENDKMALRNNGGGHINHSFFWTMMGPQKEVNQKLADEIADTFGSLDEFKKKFAEAAVGRIGSGWVWLVRDGETQLQILSTANQDSPLSNHPEINGPVPLIGLDIWEHAYYLKYQNRRAEYIENWWKVLKLI